MKPRILIAEDEISIAKTLALNLSLEKFDVTVTHCGKDAVEAFTSPSARFDMAILDVMLPDIEGFELCRQLKKIVPSLPVIFLTARDQQQDRIAGLKTGADDYITKPFDLEELLLRVHNILRRAVPAPDLFSFPHGNINFETYEVTDINGRKTSLSRREIGLLKLLTTHQGKVVSREQILNELWDADDNASSRTIDNYILGFRKLFEPDPRKPAHFHSIRGVGYRFTAEPDQS